MIIDDAFMVVWVTDSGEILRWFASDARMLYIQTCLDAIRDNFGAMQVVLLLKTLIKIDQLDSSFILI